MNEFYEDMFSENLATYKLTDSSYIVAEELEIDPETGSIYVANPLEMIRENGGVRLRPWILVDTDEIVEINSANIVCRTEAPKVISKYYLKYIAYDKLISNIQKLDDEDDLDTDVTENFADGKKKGKSKPGRVKKAGASCNGSVTALRKRAKDSSGEKSKMYHWCANMKSGKKKTNEGIPLSPSAELAQDYIEQDIESGKIADLKDIKKAILQLRLSGVIDYNEDARELWKHYVLANHKALPEV